MFMKRNRCYPASESSIFRVTVAPDTITKLKLDVEPGQGAAASGMPCENVPTEQTAAVRIRVTDRRGAPVSGVWVGLYLRSGLHRSLLLSSARTGPDGNWCFSPVDVGAYILKAQWVDQNGKTGRKSSLEDAAEIHIREKTGLWE